MPQPQFVKINGHHFALDAIHSVEVRNPDHITVRLKGGADPEHIYGEDAKKILAIIETAVTPTAGLKEIPAVKK